MFSMDFEHDDYIMDLYLKSKKDYLNYKFLLKDLTATTITNFFDIFFNLKYKAKDKYLNDFDIFLQTFYDEFKDSELNINFITNSDLFYLKLHFLKRCIEGMYIPDRQIIVKKFADISFDLINFNTFCLNFDILKYLLKFYSANLTLDDLLKLNERSDIKYKLIALILLKILLKNGNDGLATDTLKQLMLSLTDFIIEIQSILKTSVINVNESGLQKIENRIITTYNKIIYILKSSYSEIYTQTLNKLTNQIVLASNLESYITLLKLITDNIFYSGSTLLDSTNSKLLSKIFTSNNPILHKLSIEILTKIHSKYIKDKQFLEKYIAVFDILDGYNSHLFKSLWKDLENIIQSCENFKEQISFEENIGFYIQSSTAVEDVFNIPFNYFRILSKKILNHENTKVQKFFIKSFCSLKFLSNQYFGEFLYHTLMIMLNNSIFYPENENITYHTKLGLIIEDFFTNWFRNCKDLDRNIYLFLKGIYDFITFKKIKIYLLNAIGNVFKNSDLRLKPDEKLFEIVNLNVEQNLQYISIYQMIRAWENILSLVLATSDVCQIGSKRFLGNFLNFFIFKYLNNIICLEGLNLLDLTLIYKSPVIVAYIVKMIELVRLENINPNFEAFDNFLTIYRGYKIQLGQELTNETSVALFWFYAIFSESGADYIQLFKNNLLKLDSPYMDKETKDQLKLHFCKLSTLLIFLLDFNNESLAVYKTGIERYIHILTDVIVELMNESFKNLNNIDCCFVNTKPVTEETVGNTNKIAFAVFTKFCDKETKALNTVFNNYFTIPHLKAFNEFERLSNSNDLITMLDAFLENVFSCAFELLLALYFDKELFVKSFNATFCDTTCKLIERCGKLETFLETNEKLFITDEFKAYYFNCLASLVKIKTILFTYFYSNLTELQEDFQNILVYAIANSNENDYNNLNTYLIKLVYFLEKSNDDDMFYVYRLLNMIKMLHPKTEIDKEYFDIGLRSITEKRENLKYLNVITFLEFFINKNTLLLNKDLVNEVFQTLIELNEKRTWLMLKIAIELLIGAMNVNPELITGLEDVIILLAEAREVRGDDAFMIETCPRFIYSPFNVKPQQILKNNFENVENISKYGLYIRISILELLDNLFTKDANGFVDSLAIKVLEIINSNSSNKSEMQFTTKHRKKTRLAQLLVIISKYLSKNTSESAFEIMEKNSIDLFEKVNLSSVRFYFDLFSINLAILRPSYLNYLIKTLSNPQSRTHTVSSCLVILSILLLEKSEFIDKEKITNIYEIIISLCTSNVCNIRGFAQYFMYKIYEGKKDLVHINLSDYFYKYLSTNSYIQKFFKKFDESFEKYNKLIRQCNVKTLLENNLDEINCEIVPIDLVKEFKSLAMETIPIENEDFTRPIYSWKLFATDNEEVENIEIADFQKKYRPDETFSLKKQKKKRLDIIIMASLIDKAPNLGGLARTCEVFNMGAMTISSESVLSDIAFTTAASSAEKWLPLINLPTSDIEQFIKTYKKLGYSIIGLEQTANSITLREFEFKEKCLIVLGNEREGIPQNLINLIDYCIIIPQFGEIRSLNVHVSAALMLWEMVNCLKK
jgi:tRNA G18 (ribose-2'-O)-methylase SpoU